jgi:predicted transcriptional regulator
MNLKKFIEETGITPAKFARRSDIPASTVYSLIKGATDPKLSIALKIEAATRGRVTIRDLMNHESQNDRDEQ